MEDEGRLLTWIADKTGYKIDTIYSMKLGRRAVTERFAKLASDPLGMPVYLLFAPLDLPKSTVSMLENSEAVAD
jgi:hypothetical protein